MIYDICLSLPDWPSIIISRSTYVAGKEWHYFILFEDWGYSIVYMYYSFFIHSSINGQDLDVYHWEKNKPETFCGFEPREWEVARFVSEGIRARKTVEIEPKWWEIGRVHLSLEVEMRWVEQNEQCSRQRVIRGKMERSRGMGWYEEPKRICWMVIFGLVISLRRLVVFFWL